MRRCWRSLQFMLMCRGMSEGSSRWYVDSADALILRDFHCVFRRWGIVWDSGVWKYRHEAQSGKRGAFLGQKAVRDMHLVHVQTYSSRKRHKSIS